MMKRLVQWQIEIANGHVVPVRPIKARSMSALARARVIL